MVFGLFKKKPDKGKVALEFIPYVLQVQLTLGGGGAAAIAADHWALGYVFGFHDGVLQALEVNDQTESMAMMAVSYLKLFGGPDTGAKLFRQCLDLQRNQMFMKGVFAGGGEAVAYLRDRTPPMGLARHLQDRVK
ncbi:MAG: hypothetical protein AB7O52_15820 [Planctomycetota bacterium]